MPTKLPFFVMWMLFITIVLAACNNNLAFIPASTTAVSQPTSDATAATAPLTATTAVTTTVVTPTVAMSSTPTTGTTAVTTTVTTTPTTAVTTAVTTTAALSPTASGGQAGALLQAELVETVTMTEINRLNAGFYPASNLIDALYGVAIYRLTVQSSNETGAPIQLQTDLYLPQVTRPRTFPVLAYAPGTTGLGDGCAPSQEYALGRQWGSYRTHMLSYASQGMIGVLPDGMSYRDPARPHEYFIGELEAYTLLDSARAAYNFLAKPPAEVKVRAQAALFFAGYSNGGHSAFAAKDFAADYAPELPLRGVISHGATTSVEALLRESPIFTPYLIYAYRHFFGADVIGPEQVFLENWLPTFDEDALTLCVDDIFVHYTNDPQGMYRPEFRTALFNETLADSYPLFKAVIDANYAGTFGGFDIPAAFFQGTADYVVTPASQQRFATFLCEQGQPVTYTSLPAVQHVNTRQVSFKATLAWMQSIAQGQKPPNNCAQLTATNK